MVHDTFKLVGFIIGCLTHDFLAAGVNVYLNFCG